MGKKSKVGKQRKDKFYHLAKDAGFRSRAAFKLLQLNRKYEFLGRSRVLVDLCAAPGGWLQVAQKYMPVSSVIVGVDLVPIKPIPNVVTIVEDITTDKCRQQLKRELKTWKADVVLHDGAPNVGKSWIHDAFAQAQLTLHAFKLACEMLVKGGWFITKVFRSKDYNALLWSFSQLFKKVHATKPQASRNESAEIFVICQHYLAPDKVDPKFFDIGQVFKDTEGETKPRLKLFGKEKTKVKAEGYPEGDHTLFHSVLASEFINSNNHMETLASCTEIVIDADNIKNHKLTTQEVIECCKDIKVLGRKELKDLLQWKRLLKKDFDKENKVEEKDEKSEKAPDAQPTEPPEEEFAEGQLSQSDARRKKKKLLKEKRRQQNKLNLQMVIKDDVPLIEEDIELFRLSQIRKKQDMLNIEQQAQQEPESDNEKEPLEDETNTRKRKLATYSTDEKIDDWCVEYTTTTKSSDEESNSDDDDDDEEVPSDSGESSDYIEEDENDKNPLLVDIDDPKTARRKKADLWYDKQLFTEYLGKDEDEDLEIDMMADVQEKMTSAANTEKQNAGNETGYNSDSESDSSDSSSSEDEAPKVPKKKRKKIRLDPEGLALGTLMVQSSKSKRDILDRAFNRYTFNDDNLPDWFEKDEKKHNRPNLPVSPEMIQEYKDRLKEINARPIKKVAEAKARKKKRALRKMDKARRRAEAITENADMTEHEKAQHIKNVYKKALKSEDKKVTYVFPKKGIGKKVRRPPGVKGKFKVVDKRMKKDDRMRKTQEKKKKNPSVRRKKRTR